MKLLNNYHPSWENFLTEDIRNEIEIIENSIKNESINPEPENVLRFLNNDLYSVKVVILGQDPYPEKNRATGRAFEVDDLEEWTDKFRQVSLKNMIRLIYKSYNHIENYSEIKKFSDIQKEIISGKFKILPPSQIFKSWEKQGVLLLNTYLTVKSGETGSHIKLWENFSEELLKYISSHNPNIRWFLWGRQAEEKSVYITSGVKYISRHPMMCSDKYDDDFLKSNCFKDTMNEINWLGL